MYPFIGLIVLLPLIGSFTTPLVKLVAGGRKATFLYASIVGFTVFLANLYYTITVYTTGQVIVYKAGGWPPPIGVVYVLDKPSMLLALVTSLIVVMIIVYSADYIKDERYGWYLSLLLGNEAGLLVVILTGDYFHLFVGLEVTAVSAYALVMYYRNRGNAIISALKYAFVGSLGTTLFLLALSMMYNFYGTLSLVDFSLKVRGEALSVSGSITPSVMIISGLILVLSYWTFSIKSGVFPNHFWLPDAHPAAPTPISALLSGLVVNTGVVGLYKLLYVGFAGDVPAPVATVRDVVSLIVVVTGAVSGIIGALLMSIQSDVKRLIAYSTVMNTGLIFMGVGVLSKTGVEAFLYYAITHTMAKSLMFLSAGILIKATGSRRINMLYGSGRVERTAGFAMVIATLTLSGIPPFPGFMAKLLLYQALFEYNPLFALLMILASTIALVSYMRLMYVTVLEPPVSKFKKVGMSFAKAVVMILAVLVILLGSFTLFSTEVFNTVFSTAAEQVGDIVKYLNLLKTHLV